MADALFLVSVLLLAAAGTPPAPPPTSTTTTTSCSDELVSFSPCLPYISSSPNNISDSPPIQCCDNFAAAFENNTAICLCYLVHNPLVFGFPIDSSKLTSLTSMCPVKDKKGQQNFSLKSLCSGSTMLPPFRSITDHRGSRTRPRRPSPRPSPRPRPHLPHPGDDDNPSPQVPPGPGSSLPPPSNADDKPSPAAQHTPSCSSATEINCDNSQFLAAAIFIYLFYMLFCLYAMASF